MDHKNYKDYTLKQLYDALDTVDNVKYPGQLKLLEVRIEELEYNNIELEGFKNPQKITSWVKYFLYMQVIISVVAMGSGYMEYQLLSDYSNGVYTLQEQAVADGEVNDARQGIVGIIQMVIFIVSGILILKWIYRANYNARQLGAQDMQFTPGWSVGWYFIPIASLWKPYQAMKEIWKASHAPSDWKESSVPALLQWWWFFFIVTSILNNVSFRITLRAEELSELMYASIATQISDISSIPLALITMAVIMGVHKAQMSKHINHS